MKKNNTTPDKNSLQTLNCVGFDCGNSSIRTILGCYNGNTIDAEIVHQAPNGTVRIGEWDCWDILYIFDQMQKGLKAAVDAAGGKVDSAGISTWGVDFGLFGQSGLMLGNPLCYRSKHGALGMANYSEEQLKRMFELSGIQNIPINSVYQLAGIRDYLPEYYQLAEKVMLTPDLLNFLFTGQWNSETSMASTTGLMNMTRAQWDEKLFEIAGIKKGIMPNIVQHGQSRGTLTQELANKLGIPRIPFISIPGHDTAAAVVTVSSEEDHFVFISSGTWSLIGTELNAPIINDAVYEYNLANEGGACGTITLLKNSTGMYILQRVKKELEYRESRSIGWTEMQELAERRCAESGIDAIPVFDPNNETLYNPKSMIKALETLTGTSQLDQILASVHITLAQSYCDAIAGLEKIVGRPFPAIHIIGGGSRNGHINQLTANISGKPVVAGSEEATSTGTVAAQLLYHFPDFNLRKIREIVARSVEPKRYEPEQGLGKNSVNKPN